MITKRIRDNELRLVIMFSMKTVREGQAWTSQKLTGFKRLFCSRAMRGKFGGDLKTESKSDHKAYYIDHETTL